MKSIEQGIDSLPPKANQEARLRTGSAYSADIKEGNSLQVEFNDEKKLRLLEQGLEKPATLEKTMNESEVQAKGSGMKRNRNDRIWLDWFSSFNFWKICVIYMLSRLYVNVTQVYTPLYLQETLRLAKVSNRSLGKGSVNKSITHRLTQFTAKHCHCTLHHLLCGLYLLSFMQITKVQCKGKLVADPSK